MYEHTAEKYDKIFRFNPDVVSLIEEYMPPGGSGVLDIGCGTGKYAGKLSGRFRVVGIDTDKRSIEIAWARHPGAEFINTDLLSYRPDGKFDLIFCIGNVISHIMKKDLPRFLRQVRSNLTGRGVWLFHTINWDKIINLSEYTFPVLEHEGIKFMRAYRNITGDAVVFVTVLTDENGSEIEECITLYPQTASEIDELHEGFERLALYSNYRKDPHRPVDISRVYVFRKADS
jgi:SAM-dependent methyltransferase